MSSDEQVGDITQEAHSDPHLLIVHLQKLGQIFHGGHPGHSAAKHSVVGVVRRVREDEKGEADGGGENQWNSEAGNLRAHLACSRSNNVAEPTGKNVDESKDEREINVAGARALRE